MKKSFGPGRVLLLALLLAMALPGIPARAADKTLDQWGMVPIYARDIADGTYPISVSSTSPFFKIRAAELVVESEEMYARITIGSHSYLHVFLGTGKEADQAPESQWIHGERLEDGTVFTVPVEALDREIDCAAFSKNRQRWYDRRLLFHGEDIPAEALAFPRPDYPLIAAAMEICRENDLLPDLPEPTPLPAATPLPSPEPVAADRSDGEYSVEVVLTGGSGRASVSSPTLLLVKDGKAYARLLWSSSYYDYMLLDGQRFENLAADGGSSTFEIPITIWDEAIPVIADTTAMGDAMEIEYTLTFYSDSVGGRNRVPQEAARNVLWIGLSIIVAGGILNHFVKKKRK